MRRVLVVIAVGALGLSGCARSPTHPLAIAHRNSSLPAEQSAGCGADIPQCDVKRLPDLTLTNGQTDGALGPVDGMETSGLISFDDALRRAVEEDGIPGGKTVRVVLGSADADQLNWGSGTNLYYAIEWSGVCTAWSHVGVPGVSPKPPGCTLGQEGTVIDAKTGAFIVSGASSG
jgi:hypothetical protein